MMNIIEQVKLKMIEFNESDPKRIQHFLKVHSFAVLIGELEKLDEKTMHILNIASLTHDIGIRPAEQKYGSCSGKLQEKEGVAPARQLLTSLEIEEEVIQRVCYLIAHHHTYDNIDGLDYQILVEADFLVNLYEDESSNAAIKSAKEKIFKTKSGIMLCDVMFGQ